MSTIILNAEASGREGWESSPFMDMRNPSLVLSPATESMNMETEYTSGSGGNSPDVSAAKFPDGWPVGPGRDMPALVERSAPEFSQVDLNEWCTQYMACMRYFLDESQHTRSVKARAAFINIRLPCQRVAKPIVRFAAEECGQESNISLSPYIRRLIVTGQDMSSVLRDFFGDAWLAGIGCIWKQERLNYLFTAKSGGWAPTKAAYDILPDEHVPFLQPIREPTEEELRTAESRWSDWMAMEDWMVGSRSPW